MPVGPRRPSIATLETIASRYGISLDAEEAESYREVMQGVFNVYRWSAPIDWSSLNVSA